MADFLSSNGIEAKPFHADLNSKAPKPEEGQPRRDLKAETQVECWSNQCRHSISTVDLPQP